MRSPGFPDLPRPTGPLYPPWYKANPGHTQGPRPLTHAGQGLRVPGCATPSRSARLPRGALPGLLSSSALPAPTASCSLVPKVSLALRFRVLFPSSACGDGPGAGLEAGSPAQSERDPRARRTWGRSAPATQRGGGKANRWPSARGSHPFPRALRGTAAQPGPEDTGPARETRPAAPRTPDPS